MLIRNEGFHILPFRASLRYETLSLTTTEKQRISPFRARCVDFVHAVGESVARIKRENPGMGRELALEKR
jgi:hypothetical protein